MSLRAQIKVLLEKCAAGQHTTTANFAAGLLEEYEALWTLSDVPDLQIDRAERAVRHAVLMRKLQGGTQSDRGSRWIERIQSVRETCRLQDRPVLAYLTQVSTAAQHRRPAPAPSTLARPDITHAGTPAITTTPRERLREPLVADGVLRSLIVLPRTVDSAENSKNAEFLYAASPSMRGRGHASDAAERHLG